MTELLPKTSTVAFTIVTPNYLAHAYSLRQSFLQHNAHCNFFICLVGNEVHVPEKKGYDFFYLDQLKDERIAGMIARYNPFELSCALKPYFAYHILTAVAAVDRLIYLDGDMHVFGTFRPLTNAAITLSPHRTVNVNYIDGLANFSTISLLKYGVYNAGYFELHNKPEAFNFLTWWQMLMENYAYNKPEEHMFTDQLWLTAVPSFFNDVFINKDPGYNVGFWNLIERKLLPSANGYTVNGQPLVLFHYSNYKIEDPDRLVNFDDPYLSFTTLKELKPVFEQYRQGVLDAGYDSMKTLDYPFLYQQPNKKKSWLQKLFLKK
jgi:hypothetical protein